MGGGGGTGKDRHHSTEDDHSRENGGEIPLKITIKYHMRGTPDDHWIEFWKYHQRIWKGSSATDKMKQEFIKWYHDDDYEKRRKSSRVQPKGKSSSPFSPLFCIAWVERRERIPSFPLFLICLMNEGVLIIIIILFSSSSNDWLNDHLVLRLHNRLFYRRQKQKGEMWKLKADVRMRVTEKFSCCYLNTVTTSHGRSSWLLLVSFSSTTWRWSNRLSHTTWSTPSPFNLTLPFCRFSSHPLPPFLPAVHMMHVKKENL